VVAWVIFLIVLVPLLGMLLWVVLDESIVRIEPGRLGLLLVRGRPTDTALEPGVHFVPALRRRMVQAYPSLELSYRAGDGDGGGEPTALERSGPPLRVNLGDRSVARISYTVRFRLDRDRLRTVHERFGPDGVWAAVRDESDRTFRNELSDPRFSIEDLFGSARDETARVLSDALQRTFDADGFVVTSFGLGDVDLGRTGEVIQATTRANYELAREQAESETRLARARNDAELGNYLTGEASDTALRYREVDVWRELVQILADRSLAVGGPGRVGLPNGAPLADGPAAAPAEPEQTTVER
jgi:regulator of protease activity HflC (stomatin/prohibitin superfamily)